MAAEKGNQYHLAIKNPEMRQKAYNQFCEHLAKGKSIKSWYFEDGEVMCTWETMLSYIEKNPDEFASIKKEISHIKGFQHWESVCEDSASGKNKEANTASLQMIMRNKYGWDKKEDNNTNEIPEETKKILDKLISSHNNIKE